MYKKRVVRPILTVSAVAALLSTAAIANPQAAEEYARAMNLDIAATPEQGPGGDQGPPTKPYDPLQSHINLVMGMAQARELNASEFARLQKDPRYQTYLKGGWEYFDGRPGAAPGEYCTAVFWRKEGFIILSGPGDNYDGAMLMFAGEDVPIPSKLKMVKATLTQTSASPATIKAFNFQKNPENPSIGTIAFAVPSAAALIGGMEDKNDFAVSISGKEVFRLGWHQGLDARDKWAECVNKRKSRP